MGAVDISAAATSLRTRARVRSMNADVVAACAAALLATALGVWALQLWKADLSVPYQIESDSIFGLMTIKGIIAHGWYLTNPSLGAPIGQELYDYPAYSGDSLYLLIIRAIALFSGSLGVVVNTFFLLCFGLIAISAYAVMRRLGVSIGAALVCAVLYALLPYRLGSFEFHIFLSSYFIVPVSCYVILRVFEGATFFTRDARRRGPRAYLTRSTFLMVVLCLVIGSADNYFALFTVALVAGAAVLTFLARRQLRPLVGGLAAAAIIVAAVVLNASPTILYHVEHGPGIPTATRVPRDTDLWALSLTNLVMPVEGSRIPSLASLAHEYNTTAFTPQSKPPLSEPAWVNLGLLGTLGLLWLGTALTVRCLRPDAAAVDSREVHAALGAAGAFLIGTVGGLATLFAYVVSPQLHAPVRIIVFLAFFALLGAALGLDRVSRLMRRRGAARLYSLAILPALLIAGVLYQTSPDMALDYKAGIARYDARQRYVRAIESSVPSGSSILQLPYTAFPASGTGYPYLEDYLVSSHLIWSGGAMEGRPADWQVAFAEAPLPRLLEVASALGFAGVSVELGGIEQPRSAVSALARDVGVEPVVGVEGTAAFFDMAAYNRRLRERDTPRQIAALANSVLGPASR